MVTRGLSNQPPSSRLDAKSVLRAAAVASIARWATVQESVHINLVHLFCPTRVAVRFGPNHPSYVPNRGLVLRGTRFMSCRSHGVRGDVPPGCMTPRSVPDSWAWFFDFKPR